MAADAASQCVWRAERRKGGQGALTESDRINGMRLGELLAGVEEARQQGEAAGGAGGPRLAN